MAAGAANGQPEGTRGGLEGSSRGRAARLRFRNRLIRLASVLYKSCPAIVALRDGQHVLVRENAELGTDSSFSELVTEARSCDVCAARRRSDWAVGRAEPAPGDTLDHIAGLSVAHDITMRDQQHRIQHWLRARRGMPAPRWVPVSCTSDPQVFLKSGDVVGVTIPEVGSSRTPSRRRRHRRLPHTGETQLVADGSSRAGYFDRVRRSAARQLYSRAPLGRDASRRASSIRSPGRVRERGPTASGVVVATDAPRALDRRRSH